MVLIENGVVELLRLAGSLEMAYRIEYSPSTVDHFAALTARQRALVLYAVESQLMHEPLKETRNRKPMRPNPLALWELRVGELRVYYDVDQEPEPMILVRAVGVKKRDRVLIGSKEFQL